MLEDRTKWNEKYRQARGPAAPAPSVKKFIHLAPVGKALDIATGAGSNAFFAAEKGFHVDAVDISDVAIFQLFKRHRQVYPICADLDFFTIPQNRYSLILNIQFLDRRLFPYIREGLIPGGLLIFETCLQTPHTSKSDVPAKDYFLRENELLHAFLSLNILFYQETQRRRPKAHPYRACLVARKRD